MMSKESEDSRGMLIASLPFSSSKLQSSSSERSDTHAENEVQTDNLPSTDSRFPWRDSWNDRKVSTGPPRSPKVSNFDEVPVRI